MDRIPKDPSNYYVLEPEEAVKGRHLCLVLKLPHQHVDVSQLTKKEKYALIQEVYAQKKSKVKAPRSLQKKNTNMMLNEGPKKERCVPNKILLSDDCFCWPSIEEKECDVFLCLFVACSHKLHSTTFWVDWNVRGEIMRVECIWAKPVDPENPSTILDLKEEPHVAHWSNAVNHKFCEFAIDLDNKTVLYVNKIAARRVDLSNVQVQVNFNELGSALNSVPCTSDQLNFANIAYRELETSLQKFFDISDERRKEYEDLKKDHEDLKEDYEDLKEDYENLKEDYEELMNKFDEANEEKNGLVSKIEELEDQIARLMLKKN